MGAECGHWQEAIESALRDAGAAHLRRAMVIAETESTQGVASALGAAGAGSVVVADRQTAGRGRFGRTWVQGAAKGVAITAIVDAAGLSLGHISLGSGLAAARTCMAHAPSASIGLKWPNDVVERDAGRKLAGVLVERKNECVLIGVGINVEHESADFVPELNAVSLRQLGSTAGRLDVMRSLVVEIDRIVSSSTAEIVDGWRLLDVLTGTHASFEHHGRTITGLVRGIDPTHEILVEIDGGTVVRLPAMETSVVKR